MIWNLGPSAAEQRVGAAAAGERGSSQGVLRGRFCLLSSSLAPALRFASPVRRQGTGVTCAPAGVEGAAEAAGRSGGGRAGSARRQRWLGERRWRGAGCCGDSEWPGNQQLAALFD